MAGLTYAQRKAISQYVQKHYKKPLRVGATKKFRSRAKKNLASGAQDPLAFLTGRTKAAPKKAPPKAPKPKKPPLDYERYLGVPGREELLSLDRKEEQHKKWGTDVSSWLGDTLKGINDASGAANTSALAAVQQSIPNAAVGSQLPSMMGTLPGGISLNPGLAAVGMNQANTQAGGDAHATKLAGQHNAAVANDRHNILSQGLLAGLASKNQELPHQYNQARQKKMQEMDQAMAEAEQARQEQELEMYKIQREDERAKLQASTSMYGDQLSAMGKLLGIQGDLSEAQLSSDTRLATAGLNAETQRLIAGGKLRDSAANRASNERIKFADIQTKAQSKQMDRQIKLQVQRMKNKNQGKLSRNQRINTIKDINKAFDANWLGKPPSTDDLGKKTGGWGWRYTATGKPGTPGRKKAASQALAWLMQYDGIIGDAHMERLMRSKGFTRKEINQASKDVQGGF